MRFGACWLDRSRRWLRSQAPPNAEEITMLTIAILSLVLIPVAVDLAVRRHRQTITLSLVRPR
jgi:hypothetical protein